EYVPVAEDEGDDPIEVPTEAGGVLLLSTLAAQFPGLTGLRYRNPDTSAMRAVRLTDGVLYPPPEFNSWSHNGNVVYLCTFPKDNKRKVDEQPGDAPDFRPKKPDRKNSAKLVMSQIKRNSEGGSRGYGFIRFAEFESQIDCLTCPKHHIMNRWCEVKVPISQAAPVGESRRVFVGSVTEEMTSEVLKDFFSQHGTVEEVYIPKPFRNFAFVTFADSSTVERLVERDFDIEGKTIHVATVIPKYGGGIGVPGGRQMRGGRGGSAQMGPPRGRGWQPMGGGGGGGGGGPGGGQIGSGGAPGGSGVSQDVVNVLASNPQVLAAALTQVTSMATGGGGAMGGDQGGYGNYW
uniref:RRM domain-containing protein n=1 Tax=Macrostomum lignano TaxID=282301 RepID=A0A1I8H624_9PLAT